MNEIPMLAKKKQGKMKQMWQTPSGGVQEGPKIYILLHVQKAIMLVSKKERRIGTERKSYSF